MGSVASLRSLAATLAALAAAALAAGAATAATAPVLGCPGPTTKPFAPWLDVASYTLAPGGAFEGSTSSWSLAGGAKLTTGNEPFQVRGKADSGSLAIPSGGTATSPAFCVGIGSPTARLFATSSGPGSLLEVDVTYKTVLGTITHPVGIVLPMRAWDPTPVQLLLANVTGLTALDGLTSSVQLRFKALGPGSWKIDDVYVDPWKIT